MINLQIAPLLITILLFCLVRAQTSNPVSTCRLENNLGGTCVPLKNCTSALNDIKNKKTPINCGFNGLDPIVCCERSSEIVTVGLRSALKCKENYEAPLSSRSQSDEEEIPILGVVGGVDSLSKEFPHMAVLGFGEEDDIKWSCGGSLISTKFVLTAAHCLSSPQLGQVKFVRLGDLDLQDTNDDALPQNFKVARRIYHPKFKPPLQYHDIALLELDRYALITNYVRPACLHATKEIPVNDFIATGWGTLSFGGNQANHLQKVDLRGFTHAVCKEAYGTNPRRLNKGIDDDIHLCAGADRKDTCQGDSGGPLQIRNVNYVNGYNIIGVTSFGKACGISDNPSVYTRVSNYIEWIESEVWPN